MTLAPQSEAVLKAMNASGVLPFRQFSAQGAREKILSLRAAAPPASAYPMWKVSEQTVATGPSPFRVRILQPREPKAGEAMPVVIYFHGGGYFAGGLDETDEMVRQIATVAEAIAINVDYHLSPEAKFPTAIEQGYAALGWGAENAAALGADPNRIVVAGDSAGGNLLIVLCMMARERGGPPIRFQVAIYPSLDCRAHTPYDSRARLGRGDLLLSNEDIEWMLGHYLNDSRDAEDWRASPILAPSFAGLPPALVMTADHDPLVDEGRLYADKLRESRVPVEYICFEGTFHGFVGYASVLEVGARGLALVCDRIRQAVAT